MAFNSKTDSLLIKPNLAVEMQDESVALDNAGLGVPAVSPTLDAAGTFKLEQ